VLNQCHPQITQKSCYACVFALRSTFLCQQQIGFTFRIYLGIFGSTFFWTDDDLSYIDTLLEILPILCVVAVILIMVFMDCKRLCCCKKKQEKGKGKRKGPKGQEKKKGLEVGEKEVEVVENFSGGAKIVPVLTDQTVSSDTPPATGNDLPIIRRNSRRDRPSIKSEPSEFK